MVPSEEKSYYKEIKKNAVHSIGERTILYEFKTGQLAEKFAKGG
jgi:hypothetical protein